jgi:hypothetical protein
MSTIGPNEAANYLSWLLENGLIRSQYEEMINSHVRHNDQSWYSRMRKEQGYTKAEEELAKWEAARHMRTFASTIESTAQGMLAVAKADKNGEYVHVVTNLQKQDSILVPYKLREPAKRIVIINPEVTVYDNHASIFGIYGLLGLKAIILTAGSTSGTQAELGLVLPNRRGSKHFGFTVAVITCEGFTDVHSMEVKVSPDGFLYKELGVEVEVLTYSNSQGGNFDDGIGFPGASDYLAMHLPRLGNYLIQVAKQSKQ